MLTTLLLFLVGFYILIKGANVLVDGSASLARKLEISPFVIGLVIVGIGTSIPEFAITLFANLTGKGDVGLGTVIGSNTFNILFILGVSTLFFPLAFNPRWAERNLLWNISSVAVALFVAMFGGDGIISRIEGLGLVALFCYWLYRAVKTPSNGAEDIYHTRALAIPFAVGMVLAGTLGILIGGKWVVDGAVAIARELGASEAFIALTIISIGTSLPEFVASFVAAYRKQPGIAVGNIIGSNIFDFLFILGTSAAIKPFAVPDYLLRDMVVTMLTAGLLYGSLFVGEQYVLKRWQGLAFIALYLGYAIYLLPIGK